MGGISKFILSWDDDGRVVCIISPPSTYKEQKHTPEGKHFIPNAGELSTQTCTQYSTSSPLLLCSICDQNDSPKKWHRLIYCQNESKRCE
jgi:hypothetical protein